MTADSTEKVINAPETPPFEDPWKTSPEDEDQLRIRIPFSEKMFIAGIRPMRGTWEIVVNNLLKGLIDECKLRNITTYSDVRRFEQLVLDRSRSTLSLFANNAGAQTDVRDDRGGSQDIRPSSPGSQDERADVPSRSGKGKRGTKGKSVNKKSSRKGS